MADKTLRPNESFVQLLKDINTLSAGTHAIAVTVIGFKSDNTPVLLPVNTDGLLSVAADTELPVAAALADGATNPTAPTIGAGELLFNGATWDRERNNHEVTVLASAARTGDTASGDQVNYNARGMALLLDVTAVGTPAGQIDAVNIQAKIGANYATVYSFGTLAINAVGQHAFLVYPGAATAGSWKAAPAQGIVPRNWRLQVDHANETDSITYSVVACYLV
jgi:hypothetical protein